jgi:hypothetical protein
MSWFMSICLETGNSSYTPWLPEIITPVPFVRRGCVNTCWKCIKVAYNFCVVCFCEIYIIWGQQLVLWWLLTPDRFYPKGQNWTEKVAALKCNPNLKGSWAILHLWFSCSFSSVLKQNLTLALEPNLFPGFWLNSALWPYSQIAITLVQLTQVSHVRVHGNL